MIDKGTNMECSMQQLKEFQYTVDSLTEITKKLRDEKFAIDTQIIVERTGNKSLRKVYNNRRGSDKN
jgi:hypothetical protein